ncbi:MAG: ABC transporter permease [Bacteriovoracaceae bacterium]|nr:ABC transporter permease [Bacteriovoracaceae bacterium]
METTMENPNLAEDIRSDVKSKSLWQHAVSTLLHDKLAVFSMIILATYILVALLSVSGIIAADWQAEVGPSYAAPSAENIFGTDIFGRSVFAKVVKGTEVAMGIGFATAILAMLIGVTLGSIAGYFGGKVDELIVWFYTSISSIPSIMLLVSVSFILGKGLLAIFLALGLTGWVGLCRLIRGEVMKHKQRDYVQGATAIGLGHFSKLFIHILPNVFHIVIINFSLTFQTAIKAEVILSFLGLGSPDYPSWGKLIDDSKLELARSPMVWWQLAGAAVAMFFVVLALNLLGDALRDALDPKLKGK